ncbi:hypothetical protein E3O45_05950 [Cryobacterium sp. TMS1-20-1]|uniref:hypothetical protein n=1 Tax=Cryobacterium sp. TMS1-20-1 TaxID=1259223 RepID=UPI001068D47E|nr:hypothetical protein [Cryobacterium sp. TMS1-20-1]TFC78155.1 hypothetical protein E3O45_05950 [Cryobacterium sp. TMS1-20-1]
MTESTFTPEEELAALEQAAMDGEAVTPTQMAEAREKISLFKLAAKGVTMRLEQKRKKDALALQAKTKVDVGLMFTAGDYVDPLVAYDEAVAALSRLADVVKRNNTLIAEASRALSLGGVTRFANWAAMPEDIDRANFASVGQGDDVAYVTLGGVAYTSENASLWVRAAVQDVAQQHGGLSLPQSSDLAELVRGSRPGALKNHAH